MLELRHFRYAIAVADEGHVTRAAERLGIQQPPLSQQIRALEDMVGASLFRRLPRGMELTDAGRAFIDRARQVVADADAAVDAARRAARGETGNLSIGYTSSAAFHPLVSSVVRALRLSSPDLSLRLDEGTTGELTADLMAGRLDVAFLRGRADAPEIAIECVHEEAMLLALPDDHPLAKDVSLHAGATIRLQDLAKETFIFYRRQNGQGLYDRIIAACQAAGFSPNVAQEAPKVVSTLSLVAAGLGISIIPETMARLETNGITYRHFAAGSGLTAPLYLAWRRDAERTVLDNLVAEVRAQATQLEASPSANSSRGSKAGSSSSGR